MKNIKNLTFAIFVFTGTLLFTACGSPEEHIPLPEPLTAEDFSITTMPAEVGEKEVTLSGSFAVDESRVKYQITWGFMYREIGTDQTTTEFITVGRGHAGTSFALDKSDFPEGKRFMACAFVKTQLQEGAGEVVIPGDEVEFAF